MPGKNAGRQGGITRRNRLIIYQREVCWICLNVRGPVLHPDRDGVHHMHTLARSVDHRIPLYECKLLGLDGDDLENLELAHIGCNSSHGASYGNALRAARRGPDQGMWTAELYGVDPFEQPEPEPKPVRRRLPRECGQPGCLAWKLGHCEC